MNMQYVYVSLFLVSSKLNPYSITRYRCAKVENVCIGKHDDVVKWKQFLCYCPFVSGIQRSPVDSPHKGHWHGALTFSLIPVPEQTVEQTTETPVISDAIALIMMSL